MTYFDLLLIVLFIVLIGRLLKERRGLKKDDAEGIRRPAAESSPYDRKKLNTASLLLCVFMLAVELISAFVKTFALAALILALAGFIVYIIYLRKCAAVKDEKK